MEALVSPKFKSKVEQFYYDQMTASQQDLSSNSNGVSKSSDNLKVHEARKRAYSGDGRKSYFTFDTIDIRRQNFLGFTFNKFFMDTKSFRHYLLYLLVELDHLLILFVT